MKRLSIFTLFIAIVMIASAQGTKEKPNMILILADDMGVGDLSHYGGQAPTPHIDQLAKRGMRFSDAHSSSSVCTHSRYSLLTGRYSWRTWLKQSVFNRPNLPPLIPTDEPTIGSILQDNGYHTACIGKWHLGIGWQYLADHTPKENQTGEGWDIDYSKTAITPLNNGFHYFFGIQSSLDMPPYLFIENDKALAPPTITKQTPRPGAATADFKPEQTLIKLAEKSVEYITERSLDKQHPFFLYLALTSTDSPIVSSAEWKGKSNIGDYGDFLMETDWAVGQITTALEKYELSDNTIIIFTADNGCSPNADIPALKQKEHSPSGKYRGHKADLFEGGHRVPFIVKWPGVTTPNTVSDRIICHTDIISTLAEVSSSTLLLDSGVDSISFLPSLKDPSISKRSPIIHHSVNGSLAIRSDDWKLLLCKSSGGWSDPTPGSLPADAPAVQLYQLEKDPSEQTNLALEMPEKVAELTALLEKYVTDGRSTPGYPQLNEGKVNITPLE